MHNFDPSVGNQALQRLKVVQPESRKLRFDKFLSQPHLLDLTYNNYLSDTCVKINGQFSDKFDHSS